MQPVRISEASLGAAMREPRYWQPGNPERQGYGNWVSQGWQAVTAAQQANGGDRTITVYVRPYTRVVDGKPQDVSGYEQQRHFGHVRTHDRSDAVPYALVADDGRGKPPSLLRPFQRPNTDRRIDGFSALQIPSLGLGRGAGRLGQSTTAVTARISFPLHQEDGMFMSNPGWANLTQVQNDIRKSVERALLGTAPAALVAVSYTIDLEAGHIQLRAHFDAPITDDDLEDVQVAETEIATDFLDLYSTSLGVDVLHAGGVPELLKDVAYRRPSGPLPRHRRSRTD